MLPFNLKSDQVVSLCTRETATQVARNYILRIYLATLSPASLPSIALIMLGLLCRENELIIPEPLT